MYKLKNGFAVALAVAFEDAMGNVAFVDGSPEWTSSNPEVISLVQGDTALDVVAEGVGAVGSVAQITMTADADMTDGVKPIIATLDIEIVAGDAVTAIINPGAASEIPAPVAEEEVAEETVTETAAEASTETAAETDAPDDAQDDSLDAPVEAATETVAEETVATEAADTEAVATEAADTPPADDTTCLLYTSPSPRDQRGSRMPSSA